MLNQPAPDFELPATEGAIFRLSNSIGKTLVLFFYPKDNTPGCTSEAMQFRDLHAQFSRLGCEIYGISRDSIRSHENFRSKLKFPFALLSDTEEKACKLYDIIKMKNMYGKKVRGIERSTFVIDSRGVVRREWRGVKVPGHAQEVLKFIETAHLGAPNK